MRIDVHRARRLVGAGAVVLAVAGCGGSDREAVTPATPSTTVVVEGSELAGVQFDVRRDPG